jgi:hypothetical protein
VAKRDLDLEVRRKGRTQEELTVHADPNNIADLRDVLTGWLEGNKWHPGLWDQFDLVVRFPSENRIRRTVKA